MEHKGSRGGDRRKGRGGGGKGAGGGGGGGGRKGGRSRRGRKKNRNRSGGAQPRPGAAGAAGGVDPGRAGVLPSKLWRTKGGGAGRRRGKKRGGAGSGRLGVGYSASGQPLPPPPLGPDGKPFDIEDELGEEGADEAGEDDDSRRAARARPRRKPRLKATPRDFRVLEVMDLGELGTTGPHHIHRLTKKKLSTTQALGRIAKAAGLPRSKLSCAGLKDKQAFAVQFVGIEGRSLTLRQPGLRLTPLGRRAQPIRSTDLRANRFRITVRGLDEADLAGLEGRVRELEAFGVPNYFDSQRFGSVRHGQGLMARELVRGDPEKALRLWMATPSRLDHSRDRDLKQLVRTRWGRWDELARRLRHTAYGRVLGHLRHAPDDWWGAVGYMPRQQRAFHIFAYQSYLWNRSVIELLRAEVPKRDRFTVPYVCGRLVFHRRLRDEALRERLFGLSVPLLGPETRFEDAGVERACRAALAAEGIDLGQLRLPERAGGFFRHEPRALLLVPRRLRVGEPERDELDRKFRKVELRFELPRGSYGTLVVKRLFRG